jgi:hypothetical protein
MRGSKRAVGVRYLGPGKPRPERELEILRSLEKPFRAGVRANRAAPSLPLSPKKKRKRNMRTHLQINVHVVIHGEHGPKHDVTEAQEGKSEPLAHRVLMTDAAAAADDVRKVKYNVGERTWF